MSNTAYIIINALLGSVAFFIIPEHLLGTKVKDFKSMLFMRSLRISEIASYAAQMCFAFRIIGKAKAALLVIGMVFTVIAVVACIAANLMQNVREISFTKKPRKGEHKINLVRRDEEDGCFSVIDDHSNAEALEKLYWLEQREAYGGKLYSQFEIMDAISDVARRGNADSEETRKMVTALREKFGIKEGHK